MNASRGETSQAALRQAEDQHIRDVVKKQETSLPDRADHPDVTRDLGRVVKTSVTMATTGTDGDWVVTLIDVN